MNILAEVCTKGRYLDTLPLTIVSICEQTRRPDELIIFDDNQGKERLDLREVPVFKHLFRLLDEKGIKWQVIFGEGKGQHYLHQKAQEMAKECVWRVDDDGYAESNVLEELEKEMIGGVGAVGGLVLEPGNIATGESKGKIKNINIEPNIQWLKDGQGEVEHLYSSFLFRKGIADYDLRLSPVAHREETMFSHEIFKKGFKLIVTNKCITWHFRNPVGGIRTGQRINWDNDEHLFVQWLGIKDRKMAVLNNGLGDHIVFRKLLDDLGIKDITIACCFPEVFEGFDVISIATADLMGANMEKYNLYHWMDKHNWKESLCEAYKQMYGFTTTNS